MTCPLPIELTCHLPNETTYYFFATWGELLASKAWETPGRVYLRHCDGRTVVTVFCYYGSF